MTKTQTKASSKFPGRKTKKNTHGINRSKRIAKAKKLLETTSLSMTAVAAKVGYSTGSTFSTAFLAEAGVTPCQYRLSRKKNAASASAKTPCETSAPARTKSTGKDPRQALIASLSKQVLETAKSKFNAPLDGVTTLMPPTEVIDLRTLQVTPAYQRFPRVQLVNKIISTFCRDAIQLPHVGIREDGSRFITDGNQRKTALLGMGVTHMLCVTFPSQGEAHESLVFLHINLDRIAVSPGVKFKALATAGDPTALAAETAVIDSGLKLVTDGRAMRWPEIACASSILAIVRRYGKKHLLRTFDVLTRAWGGDIDALRGISVAGTAEFLSRPNVDSDVLVQRLSSLTPHDVLNSTNDLVKLASGARSNAFAAALAVVYNQRRRPSRKAKPAKSGDKNAIAGFSGLGTDNPYDL